MTSPTAEAINRVVFNTVDPTIYLHGSPIPAMTVLLHRVCSDDGKKFDEAMRIVELFIAQALTGAPSMRRVQAWLADEREAGRCVLELNDAWICRLLKAASGEA